MIRISTILCFTIYQNLAFAEDVKITLIPGAKAIVRTNIEGREYRIDRSGSRMVQNTKCLQNDFRIKFDNPSVYYVTTNPERCVNNVVRFKVQMQ